eukprot:scaffold1442_cov128-Cylindrotheca_fusiformis.AAC.3
MQSFNDPIRNSFFPTTISRHFSWPLQEHRNNNYRMDFNVTEPQAGESHLQSLPHYDNLRLNATGTITREKGSKVDVVQDPDTEQVVVLCNLIGLLPLTSEGVTPLRPIHIDAAAVALAAHHLNVGDGTIVPEVKGLNESCNVRFTVEFADTQVETEYALNQVVELIGRDPGGPERLPSAFIGASFSRISVPTSIVTGLFGYPQVSGSSASADLDDKSQHPLFGRTMPSDADIVVPFILYLRDILHVSKLAVIHINDPYGNANALGLREAARKYAPDMDIRTIPISKEGEGTEKATLEAVKETGFRYVFCAVYGTDTLMTEAYNMDLAGNGKHNWFLGAGSAGPGSKSFEKGSPLSLAYRGVGKLRLTVGVPGMAAYDRFAVEMGKLKNPDDLEYLSSLFPDYSKNNLGSIPPFIDDGSYLSTPSESNYASLTYEAAIALGLAACSGVSSDGFLDGETHFKHFTETSFTGVSGHVSFDNITGTRDVTGTTFRLTNFVPTDVVDDATGETAVGFTPHLTDVFQNGHWEEVSDFIFNDGTPNVPPDSPPISVKEGLQRTQAILAPVIVALAAAIGILLFFERKRRQTDALWYIKKEELKFADPPEIIGRGGFGLILKAEYRGTDVAVKRVLPPRREGGWEPRESAETGSLAAPHAKEHNKCTQHFGWQSMVDKVSLVRSASSIGILGHTSTSHEIRPAVAIGSLQTSRSQLRKNFIKEMRVLSKLRHSCIATVMGAVLERGSEPMLVMEYMDHGSLYDVLHNETMHIERNLLLHILQDVSQGLRFLHSTIPQVVHCDIKSANILVDSRFRAKVADFGLSHDTYVNGITGTAYWMAPELLRGESGNTTASDVYAFGIFLYEIYSRRDPYDGEDPTAVLHLVADKLVQKRPPIPQHMPAQIQSLMQDCIQDDASMRPTFQEIDLRLKRMDRDDLRTISDDPKRAATDAVASSMSLFDIFPRHIAEALREGRAIEPEHRDMVTIFFSDIVGFTQLSADLPPRKVALLMNRLCTKFDALSREHDVFKVETIGDAYMAVTNLVKNQEKDHAKRIAEFAIDAIREANETLVDEEDPLKGYVNVRVGFHSGSVVADVVGTRNLRYCLFGDSVNTASRMESSSKANRIHCSLASAEILAKQCPSLPVTSRGLIAIKGKGELHTCWVNEGKRSNKLKVNDVASERIHWTEGQGRDQCASLACTLGIEDHEPHAYLDLGYILLNETKSWILRHQDVSWNDIRLQAC